MPAALPAKKYRPGEKSQPNQKKRAKKNQGLGNTGAGGNQRAKRILFADTECTG